MHPEWRFPNRATPPGSSAYYSVHFSSPLLRDSLALLYAWHAEMRAVPLACSDPGVARLKLQWWREELERAYGGTAQHPLLQALTGVIRQQELPAAPFLAMIDAAEAQVLREIPNDLAQLDRQGEQDQGALFELLARCHGMHSPQPLERLRRHGAHCTQVYLLRDFGALLRRDHNPLPMDLRHISGPAIDHRQALRFVASHARAGLAQPLPPGTPPVIAVRRVIHATLLAALERADFAVLDRRISLSPLRKLWIGWRVARRHSC
jgi:phytoene synthase